MGRPCQEPGGEAALPNWSTPMAGFILHPEGPLVLLGGTQPAITEKNQTTQPPVQRGWKVGILLDHDKLR